MKEQKELRSKIHNYREAYQVENRKKVIIQRKMVRLVNKINALKAELAESEKKYGKQ